MLTQSRATIWFILHTNVCDTCALDYLDRLWREGHPDLARRIIESYPLPLDKGWPSWMWGVRISVDERRERCQRAVVAMLSLVERGNPLRSRDMMTVVAKQVWETRFNEEWEI